MVQENIKNLFLFVNLTNIESTNFDVELAQNLDI